MKDKFEFTHEFTMEVIIEYQQSTVFSVAGIKLRTKLRPRETELTGQVKKTEFLEKTSVFCVKCGYKLFIDRGRHGSWVQSIHQGIDISLDFYTWCNSTENWWGGKRGYSSEMDQWSQSEGEEKRSGRCWWELFVWLKGQSLEGSPRSLLGRGKMERV